MFRIIPVCFEFNFGNLERCENEIKKFVEFYWEDWQKNGRDFKESIDQKYNKDDE